MSFPLLSNYPLVQPGSVEHAQRRAQGLGYTVVAPPSPELKAMMERVAEDLRNDFLPPSTAALLNRMRAAQGRPAVARFSDLDTFQAPSPMRRLLSLAGF